ncbi:MAG TPA: AMP-binding protein [Gammaproteobacteria bacterium]
MTAAPTLPLLNRTGNDHPVAWRNGEAVTLAQFLHEVQELAVQLPERRFLFNLCTDRYRFLATFCAALLRGQTNLLPPNHAEKTLVQMHTLYPESYGVSDKGLSLAGLDILPYPELSWESRSPLSIPQIPGDHTAAIVFTSGSTGEPQPHSKQWGSLVQVAQRQAQRLALPPTSRIVATVPPQHMYGLESSLMMPLHNGGTLHSGQPLFPADIRDALSELPGPRVLVTTPLHLRICLDEGIALPPLALILSAAAPLSQELAQRAEEAFAAPVHEIYGCTEAGAIAARRTVAGEAWHPLSGVAIRGTDTESAWVEGDHLPGPIPLQDILASAPNGMFRLLGRKADMVNVAGKRASLAALNRQLCQIPGVRDGIFFVPDDQPGVAQRLIALVVAPALTESEILGVLRQQLDPAFLPRPLYKVESLPRTATGKLPRETLIRLLGELHHG